MEKTVDPLLTTIVDYVYQDRIFTEDTLKAAYLCLMDAIGCYTQALFVPACRTYLGPIVPETEVPNGVRIPGIDTLLDPVKAAWDLGAGIRWLDYNDTWLVKEWGHPSDNLGGILAVADFVSQEAKRRAKPGLTLKQVLETMTKAYEIQGILAIDNAFNEVGIDHVILVKIATIAAISPWLGLTHHQAISALSHAWVDGQSLRTYRHAPNTNSRKSWAAGDATSRAVFLAMLAKKGLESCPQAMTTPRWGFEAVLFKGKSVTLHQPLSDFVIRHILFKVAFPAEFHAQTAIECAFELHPLVGNQWEKVDRIEIETQKPAIDIISKKGPLHNPADRDHCLQYMVAVGLLQGELSHHAYTEDFSKTPGIDALREKMIVKENPEFYKRYLDIQDRAIPNQVQVFFKDGTQSPVVRRDYPLGHPKRRVEALPFLQKKYEKGVKLHYQDDALETVLARFSYSNEPILFLDWWGDFVYREEIGIFG